ncbi:immunity 49 family protein [Streptomyces syringium]|uniref:Immunity protein 49 n=1 Tax=Streptomyces syringium TaxID=76729 RepID=A0ABS4Y8R9_9ACTN|nr:immunity 49 family protein [Streptomyces syringium]MBP2404915.1 hypothetical protein [Streptomyces syringium]
MVTHVSRHNFPAIPPASVEFLQEDVRESIDDLEQAPRMFGMALNSSLTYLRTRCALDPDAQYIDTWEATVTAMQVGSALFASASATEGAATYRIDHKLRTIPATGPQFYSDASNWLTAFWLAIVCRDQDRMTQLCEIPVDLLRAAGEYDEYIYHWVDSLQTYWLENPGLVEKLTIAIDTSHPDVAQIADRDLLNKVLYQPIALFHRFLRQDHEGFNRTLVEALELHRDYWTADEERERSVSGMLALGPLAIACLAYDAGRPIEVESGYLPNCLLKRNWLGEFPT